MNPMERVLSEDLSLLIDRLAGSIPEGACQRLRATEPTLAARLDQLDTSLAGLRAALIEDYARWTRALDDLQNVWSLASWKAEAGAPIEAVARLAA